MSILLTDDRVEAGLGLAGVAPPEIPDDVAELGERLGGLFVPAPPSGQASRAGLQAQDAVERESSPPAPVLVGVGQQGVPGEDAEGGGDDAEMERPVVGHPGLGVEPDGPTLGMSTSAEIDIFVVQEEVRIQTPEVREAVAPDQQATPRHPVHLADAIDRRGGVLGPRPRQEEPGETTRQTGERPGRELARAVGVR